MASLVLIQQKLQNEVWCFSLEQASALCWSWGVFSWHAIRYACRTSAQSSTFSKWWGTDSEIRRNPGSYIWANSFGLLQTHSGMHMSYRNWKLLCTSFSLAPSQYSPVPSHTHSLSEPHKTPQQYRNCSDSIWRSRHGRVPLPEPLLHSGEMAGRWLFVGSWYPPECSCDSVFSPSKEEPMEKQPLSSLDFQ